MEAIRIKVLKYTDKDRKPIVTNISNSLKNIQRTVGEEGKEATFEVLALPISGKREIVAVMDEEGKIKNLPPVRALRNKAGRVVDYICGVFFVCASDEEGEFVSLDYEEVMLVRDYFRDGEL